MAMATDMASLAMFDNGQAKKKGGGLASSAGLSRQ